MNNIFKTIHEQNIEKINKIFPNKVLSWEYHDEGFDSFVYTVNKEWIFKIPKRSDVWESLKREKNFLDYFFEISPVSIPKFKFFGDKIIGYKKISGQQLTKELFNSLNKKQLEIITQQLGTFLKKLHSTKCKKQSVSEYRNFFNQKGLVSLIKKIQKIIFPKVSKNIQENINDFLQKFQKNKRNFQNIQGSVHSDLFFNNILWDSDKSEIGIIDFGDIAKDSIVKDFTILADFCNSENDLFLKNLLKVYNSQDEDLFRKVKEFSKLEKLYWPIEDIEDSAIDETRENDFDKSLYRVKEVFKNKE